MGDEHASLARDVAELRAELRLANERHLAGLAHLALVIGDVARGVRETHRVLTAHVDAQLQAGFGDPATPPPPLRRARPTSPGLNPMRRAPAYGEVYPRRHSGLSDEEG